jgi:hypothetical protein
LVLDPSDDNTFSKYFVEFFKLEKKDSDNSISEAVKSLLKTPMRTTIIGSKGTGKSFLLNVLLQQSSPTSDEEYKELIRKETKKEETKSKKTDEFENFTNFSKPYNSATSYSFGSDTSNSISESKKTQMEFKKPVSY